MTEKERAELHRTQERNRAAAAEARARALLADPSYRRALMDNWEPVIDSLTGTTRGRGYERQRRAHDKQPQSAHDE